MTRNSFFQMLTILALVAAIVFVAHNFVKYVLKGKCIQLYAVFAFRIENTVPND